MADQNGYYADEGIEVTLNPRADPSSGVIDPVLNGTVEFGVTPGLGVLIARAEKLPIRAIAANFRRYPLVFMALTDSGIRHSQDFPGHTMRQPTSGGSLITTKALMMRFGLDPASIEFVEVGHDLTSFSAGELDIRPGFIFNELLMVRFSCATFP